MSIVESGESAGLSPKTIKRLANGVVLAGIASSILSQIVKGPITLAITLALAAAPLIFIVTWTRLFEVVGYSRKGRRTWNGLNPFLITAAVIVAFESLSVNLVTFGQGWIWIGVGAGSGAVIGVVTLSRGDLVGPIHLVVTLIVMGACLGVGAYTLGDVRFDPSKGNLISVVVSDKHVSHGRSTSYYLDLPAWGPKTTPGSVSVSHELYDAVQPGQEVCLTVHPGAFGAPWFDIDACPARPV